VALPAGTFAAGVLAVAVAWALWPSPEPIPRPQQVLDVKMAADHPVVAADLSADGSILAYATDDLSRDNVFVRDLTTGEVRRIAGSAGALVVELSPDGESVLITKQLSVERTSLRSGTPLLVVEAEEGNPRANWGPPGWVIYEDLQALWKVSLETGKKAPLAVRPPDGIEQDYDWPELLPDGRTVMALVENSDGTMGIGFWDFESGDRLGTTAVGGRRPQYLATGHVIFRCPSPSTRSGCACSGQRRQSRQRCSRPRCPCRAKARWCTGGARRVQTCSNPTPVRWPESRFRNFRATTGSFRSRRPGLPTSS
jgi:hypothetical protein